MVHIIDAVCGAGKTSAAINYINDSINIQDKKRFIYVTPYITEVERIQKQCKFATPVSYNYNPETKRGSSKTLDLKRLLNKGYNIVTTHALFNYFDDEIIDLCYNQGYELIMDEVHEVVTPYNINKEDLEMLLTEKLSVDNNGVAHWVGSDDYNGSFKEVKHLCDLNALFIYNGMALLWMFPVKIFRAFNETYILTYLFNAQMQRYYYDYYNIEYDYIYITGNSPSSYAFTTKPQSSQLKYNYHELINIIDDPKLNKIGDDKYALSTSWYSRNRGNIVFKQLKDNIYNFFTNKKTLWENGEYIKSSSQHNLWTTFKEYESDLKGKGYGKCFLQCNVRSTNNYKDRTVVAYTVNRFFNPIIKNFFISKGVEIDEDGYAVSEMLQFIWRSGIREGKHITLYIPSSRMRGLLIKWIDENNPV